MAGPDFQTMATINNKNSPREQTFRTIFGKTGRLDKASDQAATDKRTYLLVCVSDTYCYTSRLNRKPVVTTSTNDENHHTPTAALKTFE